MLSPASAPLSEWFSVSFDDQSVTMAAQPPSGDAWQQPFLWMESERICFKSEGLLASDGIYVFTCRRPESFVIPTEAKGGSTFWKKAIGLGLFPADLAIKAAFASEGTVLCWPPGNEPAKDGRVVNPPISMMYPGQ